MPGSTLERPPGFDQAERHYNDTTTWAAEVLDGYMHTAFEYTTDGRELYAKDGSPLGPIFEKALEDAKRLAMVNPKLTFEYGRRLIEMEEYQLMLAMSRDELPNTMEILSDFPPELMDAQQDIGGYNVTRKQTMNRVITFRDGKIRMESQSLDGSNRTALENIYRSKGFVAQPGSLLAQRIHQELSPQKQNLVMVESQRAYDTSLTFQHGGDWYAGRRPASRRNTYDFVCQQTDLLAAYQQNYDPRYESSQLYELAAALQKRFKNHKITGSGTIGSTDVQREMYEMQTAGIWAAQNGVVFSGCGLSAEMSQSSNAQNELDDLGYGNKTSCNEIKNGQHVRCPDCHLKVKAIVHKENKDKVYCSNQNCKLVDPLVLKGKKQ